MSERPGTSCPRTLRDWLNPTGARKVHSDTFTGTAIMTNLCESRMRENRTSGLSGGRRLALWRVSSDPTLGDGRAVHMGKGMTVIRSPQRQPMPDNVGPDIHRQTFLRGISENLRK